MFTIIFHNNGATMGKKVDAEIREAIKKSAVFGLLGNDDLERIAQISVRRDLQEGDIIANRGEKAAYFFILISGVLLVSMENGKSVVMRDAGDFVGFELLSSKGRYINTLTSLLKGEVTAVRRDALLDIIEEDSDAGHSIMQSWNSFVTERVPFVKDSDADVVADYQY
ncbi:MAG: cyclic nucleotide-binding domain-containing protein [Thermodesulfobacteriota bacterium]|nr:cyclic nucleotide-binding domain-containing protein [Thermodesulfobacteriota bacterium]